MALIHRISQLFRADMNAVLDNIEAPGQMLRQAIRDMEDEVAATEAKLAARGEEQEQLAARLTRVRQAGAELEAQLDLCFAQDREDLARNIVRKKLENAQLANGLEVRIQQGVRNIEKLRAQLEQNQASTESMRQKAVAFSSLEQHDTGQTPPQPGMARSSHCVDEDAVEVAFLHEKAIREGSIEAPGSAS